MATSFDRTPCDDACLGSAESMSSVKTLPRKVSSGGSTADFVDAGGAEDENPRVNGCRSPELRLGVFSIVGELAKVLAGVETTGSVSIALTMPTGNVIVGSARRRLKIKLLTPHLAGQFSNAVKTLGGR